MAKKKRAKWRALSSCEKAHIHKLQRVRNSAPRVKKWLEDNGHTPLRGRRKMMRQFLEVLGVYRHGIGINQQIENLYKDSEFTVIGRDTNIFYITPEWISLRLSILAEYGKVCMKCGSEESIAVDHIKPRSLYPELALERDNMQVLCRRCNSAKSNRSTEDYRQPKSAQRKVDYREDRAENEETTEEYIELMRAIL